MPVAAVAYANARTSVRSTLIPALLSFSTLVLLVLAFTPLPSSGASLLPPSYVRPLLPFLPTQPVTPFSAGTSCVYFAELDSTPGKDAMVGTSGGATSGIYFVKTLPRIASGPYAFVPTSKISSTAVVITTPNLCMDQTSGSGHLLVLTGGAVVSFPRLSSDSVPFGDIESDACDFTGTGPKGFVQADVDGDGILDLVVGVGSEFVEWCAGVSGDSFVTVPTTVAVPTGVFSSLVHFAVGDFNADASLDLVGAFGLSVFIVTNDNGQGTSWSSGTIADSASGSISSLIAADVTNDGTLDLVLLRSTTSPEPYAVPTTGPLTFGTPVTIDTRSAKPLAVSDVNSDGVPDILFGHGWTPGTSTSPSFGSPVVFSSQGFGTLIPMGVVDVESNSAFSTIYSSPGLSVSTFSTSTTQGQSANPYTTVASTVSNPTLYGCVRFDDLDGDGDNDLVISKYGAGHEYVYRINNGGGSFGTETALPFTDTNSLGLCFTRPVEILDVDQNALPDLVTFSDGNVVFFQATAALTWVPVTLVSSAQEPKDFAFGLISPDSLPDLVVAENSPPRVALYTQSAGSGTFNTPVALVSSAVISRLTLGDMDGDGSLDIVTYGSTIVWHRVLNSAVVGPGTQVGSFSVGFSSPFLADDFNDDGYTDVIAKERLFLGSSSGMFSMVSCLGSGTRGITPPFYDIDGDGLLDNIGANGQWRPSLPSPPGSSGNLVCSQAAPYASVSNFAQPFVDVNGFMRQSHLGQLDTDGVPDVGISFSNGDVVPVTRSDVYVSSTVTSLLSSSCDLGDLGAVPSFGEVALQGARPAWGDGSGFVKYSCSVGSSLSGDSIRRCLSTGSWSGSANQACVPVDCGPIGTPLPNGAITCSGTTYTSVCTASCNVGYTLLGTVNRTCLATGIWSGLDDATCSSVSAADSVLSPGPSILVAGSLYDFVVEVRDGTGTPLGASGLDVFDIVPLNGSPDVPFTSAPVDPPGPPGPPGPPVYKLTSSERAWSTAGTVHRYRVFINGEPLEGSPGATFSFTVVAAQATGLSSIVEGQGLLVARVNVREVVVATLRDPFGNIALPTSSTSVEGEFRSNALNSAPEPSFAAEEVEGMNGTYSVSYVAPREGLFSLTLTYNGLAFQGSPWLVQVGANCSLGSYAVEFIGPCEVCPGNTYAPSRGLRECLPCPPFSQTPSGVLGAISQGNCSCSSEYFTLSTSAACTPCPPGGVCSGGVEAPVAAAGFAPNGPGSLEFVTCPRKRACRGGAVPCARGYTGYLCNACADGFYSDSVGDCVACPGASIVLFVCVVLGLICLAVVAGLVLSYQLATGDTGMSKGEGMSAFRRRTAPSSVSMILLAMQVIGVLATARFGWSSSSEQVLKVFNVANVETSFFASECSLSSFHVTYAVSVLLVPSLLALVFVVMVGVKIIGPKVASVFAPLGAMSVRRVLDAVLFSLAPLAYLPTSRATLVLFDCTRMPNGDLVIDSNPGVACFDGAWWAVFPLGLLMAGAFVVGLPLFLAATLMARRHKLFEPRTIARFGSLYRLFRRAYFLGDVMGFGKRLFVVLVAVFFTNHQLVQISLLMAGFLANGAFLLSAKPYYFPIYNKIEFALTSVLVAFLLIGMASYSERDGNTADAVLFVFLLLTIVLFAGISIWALIRDIQDIRRERSNVFAVANARQQALVATITTELRDIDADPNVLRSFGQFLSVLDDAVHARDTHSTTRGGRCDSVTIPLDQLDDGLVAVATDV